MSNLKNIIQGFKWTAGSRLLGQLFNWGITIFVIRILSPDDYGILAISLTLTSFLIMLSEFGIGNGLVQKKRFEKPLLRKVFGLVLAINVLFFLILFVASGFIADFYNIEELKNVLRVQAFQFIFLALTVIPDAKLRHGLRFKQLSMITLASGVLGGAATFGFAYFGFHYWSLIWGDYVRIFSLVVMLYFLAPSFLLPNFLFRNTDGVARFGVMVFFNRIFFFMYTGADVLIIGKYFATHTTGLYTVAKDLATMPMMKLASTINIVAFSGFSHYEDNKEVIARYYTKSLVILSYASFPVFIGICSIAPVLVPSVLGEKWNEIIPVLQVIALSIPFRVLNLINVPLIDGIGKPEITLKYSIVAFILYVPLFWFVIDWGILAVAIVWATISPLYLVIVMLGVKKLIPIDLGRLFMDIAYPALFSVVMYLVVTYTASLLLEYQIVSGLLLLAVEIFIGALVYALLMYTFQRNQITNIISLLKT